MTSNLLTPGDLTARMSGNGMPMTDRTVRRMAEAYEAVYGPLPRDLRRNFRMFPPEAVDRLEEGARTLRQNPGASMEEVLTSQRDGQPMRQTMPTPTADTLTPILDELRALRSDMADLRALVLTLTSDRDPIRPTDASEPRPLTSKPAELLDRMRRGSLVRVERRRTLEIGADGQQEKVDARTLEALTARGLVVLDPDGAYRAADVPLL